MMMGPEFDPKFRTVFFATKLFRESRFFHRKSPRIVVRRVIIAAKNRTA